MERNRIRVLCVDDHRVVLEGIASMIARQPDMEFVGGASNGEEAVTMFRHHRPDVTVMDLQLPGMSGLDAIHIMREESVDARIVVLTMYQGDEDIARALRAGAATYLLKDTLTDDLIWLVREVHEGRRPLPPSVTRLLAGRADLGLLTEREVEVVELIAKGMRNKEIGAALGISEKTAQVHVKNILAKLHVHDRAAALSVAVQRGIIHFR